MQNIKKVLSFKYKLIVVSSLLLFLSSLDQLTKYLAVINLQGQKPIIFFQGIFQLVYAENPGAFLGMGGNWSHQTRFIIFAVVVFLGLGGMLWFLFKRENSRMNLIAYSFILSGGFGNLWDRVFHSNGHVVDFLFIDFGGPFRTGVFNLADVEIVVGVLLLLLKEHCFDRRTINV